MASNWASNIIGRILGPKMAVDMICLPLCELFRLPAPCLFELWQKRHQICCLILSRDLRGFFRTGFWIFNPFVWNGRQFWGSRYSWPQGPMHQCHFSPLEICRDRKVCLCFQCIIKMAFVATVFGHFRPLLHPVTLVNLPIFNNQALEIAEFFWNVVRQSLFSFLRLERSIRPRHPSFCLVFEYMKKLSL